MQTNLNSSAVTQRKITENMCFLKKKTKLWFPNYASFNFYVSLSERGWGNGHFVWDVGAISWADISTHFILQEIIAATSWKMWGREKHQSRERRDETSFAVMHIIWITTLSAVWPPVSRNVPVHSDSGVMSSNRMVRATTSCISCYRLTMLGQKSLGYSPEYRH